jgi:hypothetical protein
LKTTEIFVEQVLIGLLVLATGFLPYIGMTKINTGLSDIGKGAGIVAIAYLLGIILDRFADTLLSRLEQYHRCEFTIKRKKEGKQDFKSDPYPEGYLQVQILGKSGSASDRMDYLR